MQSHNYHKFNTNTQYVNNGSEWLSYTKILRNKEI